MKGFPLLPKRKGKRGGQYHSLSGICKEIFFPLLLKERSYTPPSFLSGGERKDREFETAVLTIFISRYAHSRGKKHYAVK